MNIFGKKYENEHSENSINVKQIARDSKSTEVLAEVHQRKMENTIRRLFTGHIRTIH